MISIVRQIAEQLTDLYGPDEARALAWWVVEEQTGLNRNQLLSGCKDTTNFADMQIFEPIIVRLRQFEPIQYIFEHTLWRGLDLRVTPATLIPRPETAELVDNVLNHKFARLSRSEEISNTISPLRVLDVGTGSGCIALALKQARPEWQVTGIDCSAEAIAVAQDNALRNHLEVTFQQADIFSETINHKFEILNHKFDIIVSNPPYICMHEKETMRANVLDYEPASALFVPDDDPLLFYRRIASLYWAPFLFFEINEAMGEESQQLLLQLGYTDIQLYNDSYGKTRFLYGRLA